VIHDTGFGLAVDEHTATVDETNRVMSHHYHPQIRHEEDVDKIKVPEISVDAQETERHYQFLVDLFGDILPIEKCGIRQPRFWPWDQLIQWWGVHEAMIDLTERPELIHHAMERLTKACLRQLEQYERLDLLSLNNHNLRIGSGGLGYTDQLPQPDFDPHRVRPIDLWSSAAAQIFAAVSPRMHQEFALQYERRWLKRFGLAYYGCCEPLHLKLDILRSIPNLRKVSISPWADLDQAVDQMANQYVCSYKPSPTILAEDAWDPERARRELRETLERTRGCIVEVIMKDISTVRHEPQRLWEWADIASEVTAEFA
jgi:hypothetical protein